MVLKEVIYTPSSCLRAGFDQKSFLLRHFSFPVAAPDRRKLSASSTKRGQNLLCEKPHLLHKRFIGGIHEPKIEIVGPGINELFDLVADLGGSTDDRRFDARHGRLFRAFGVSPGGLVF